jgi:hypothetical protein
MTKKLTDPKLIARLLRVQASGGASSYGKPDAYTPSELAELIGVKVDTLRSWRSQGKGPPFVVIGPRNVIYQRKSFLRWCAENENAATEAYKPRASQREEASDNDSA